MIIPLSTSRRKALAQLRQRRHRHEQELFMIEGTKSVADTLGLFDCVAVIATAAWLGVNSGLINPDTEILQARNEDMRAISSLSTPPEVIAVCRIPRRTLDPAVLHNGLTVALDGVQDPGNLGTIVRTCDWFGIRRLICSPDCVDIYNSKAIQATMGALARVEVYYADLPKLLSQFPAEIIFGTFLDGDNIYSASLPPSGIIVMGNEGNGISPTLRPHIGRHLYIPPGNPAAAHVESLNVSIATAIVLSQFQYHTLNNGKTKQ